MVRFIIRRILLTIPVILGVLLIVFLVSRLSGDPTASLLGESATDAEIAEVRSAIGLDAPLPLQFFRYVKGIVTKFDLGTSYISRRPVNEEIIKRFPVSLTLAVVSLSISLVIGVIFGVLCAINQNGKVDYIVTLVALICCSLPGFWVALMLIIVVSVKLGLLPPSGMGPWQHWVLPCGAMALGPLATLTRTTRSSMLEVIRQDYITTAKSKGISASKIIFKHALKNAIFPIITVFGAMTAATIGGSIVIETIFTFPGMGSYLATAITNRDFPVIQSTVFILSLVVCFFNLLVDIAYGFADPRIRAKYSSNKRQRKRHNNTQEQEAA